MHFCQIFFRIDKLCFGDNDIDSGVCKGLINSYLLLIFLQFLKNLIGDSGAGLVTSKMENGLTKFYLRGIVSLGETSDDGCNFAFYDVYTDIEKYIKEIYKFLLAYPAT